MTHETQRMGGCSRKMETILTSGHYATWPASNTPLPNTLGGAGHEPCTRMVIITLGANMTILDCLSWIGIASLYLGFAGILGLLARRAWSARSQLPPWILTVAYFAFLFLPSSLLVLGLRQWGWALRLGIFIPGLATAWSCAVRPRWLPSFLSQRGFAHRYFAAAMALTALWGAAVALTSPAPASTLVAAAAGAASAASLATSTRPS